MMILNVTFAINAEVVEEVEKYLLEELFPTIEILEDVAGLRYMEVLNSVSDEELTKCLHIEFKERKELHHFYSAYFPQMQKNITEKFGEKCLYYGSLLDVIKEKTT